MFKIIDSVVLFETTWLKGKIKDGSICQLFSKQTGQTLIPEFDPESVALSLVYANDEETFLGKVVKSEIKVIQYSENYVEFRFSSWNGDGVISYQIDPETDDILIEPSALSTRTHVKACRWSLFHVPHSTECALPLFQGVYGQIAHPRFQGNWVWPYRWEAPIAVFSYKNEGFWVHSQDYQGIFKALHVDTVQDRIAFESQAAGPISSNLSAGGVVWRLQHYKGDWSSPLEIYKNWYDKYLQSRNIKANRKSWIKDVKLAVTWCPSELWVLDLLEKYIHPSDIFLHIPHWRKDLYDVNYPDYTPSEKGLQFIQAASKRGFRVFPHMNCNDMDPNHEYFKIVQDFVYREMGTDHILGWSWVNNNYRPLPVSRKVLFESRDCNVMTKIHPGLAMWRSLLAESVKKSLDTMGMENLFLDVPLCMYNLENGYVDNTTTVDGMRKLLDKIGLLSPEMVLAGEGRNEVIAPYLSFAQEHLINFWETDPQIIYDTAIPFSDRLFGDFCRTIGYNNCSGSTKESELIINSHIKHNAIPTISVWEPSHLENPNPTIAKILKSLN